MMEDFYSEMAKMFREEREDMEQARIYQKFRGWSWKDCMGKAKYDRERREERALSRLQRLEEERAAKEASKRQIEEIICLPEEGVLLGAEKSVEIEEVQPIVVEDVSSTVEVVEIAAIPLEEQHEDIPSGVEEDGLSHAEVEEEGIIIEVEETKEVVEIIEAPSLIEGDILAVDPFAVYLCENKDNGIIVELDEDSKGSIPLFELESRIFQEVNVRDRSYKIRPRSFGDMDSVFDMHVFDPGGQPLKLIMLKLWDKASFKGEGVTRSRPRHCTCSKKTRRRPKSCVGKGTDQLFEQGMSSIC